VSRVTWLPEALQDTRRLFGFLQAKNPAAAVRAAHILRDGARLLTDFPEMGRPMNDGTGRRELFIPFGSGGYVLRYVIDGQAVVIIRAWHSREHRN
jgi:plasmid stabilization system protein ParE